MEPINYKEIYEIFKKYKEIFPHIRQDYLKRMITAGNVIYEDGVVIVFQKYKKKTKLGDYHAPAGTHILHQIVNADAGNGKTKEIFIKFLNKIGSTNFTNGELVLTVRSNNLRACKFYEKIGFKKVGNIDWKKGEIKGTVYLLDIGAFAFCTIQPMTAPVGLIFALKNNTKKENI